MPDKYLQNIGEFIMPRGDKGTAQKRHAQNRFAERYGVILTPRLYREAVQNIINGNFIFVERQSNRLSVFKGEVAGIDTLMVYDNIRKRIVTFLYDDPKIASGQKEGSLRA